MAEGRRFLLTYGSQTGQAKAIAEEIGERARERGFQPDLHCLSQAEKKFQLEREEVFVVVVSTTGDGDPPDTVAKFWRRLKKKTLPRDHLHRCKYALLGLGDSNYTNFCNMGKTLNKRLLEVGAQQFYEPDFADDAVGLELVVEPWIDGLWDPLEKVLKTQPLATRGCNAINHTITTLQTQHTVAKTTTAVSSLEEAVQPASVVSPKPNHSLGNSRSETLSPKTLISQNQTLQIHDSSGKASTGKCSSVVTTTPLTSASTSETKHGNKARTEEMPMLVPNPGNGTKTTDIGSLVPKMKKHLAVAVKAEHTAGPNGPSECIEVGQQLRSHSASLKGKPLTLPSTPPPYIRVDLRDPPLGGVPEFPHHKVAHGVHTHVSMATITGMRPLTNEGALKRTLEVEVGVEHTRDHSGLHYEPGDAFGFVCPNSTPEVDYILHRLRLEPHRDKMIHLSIIPGTTKKNAILPKHIPNPCSMHQFFTHCADIRCVPKKVLLCLLSTFCSNERERRRLEELSSRQGASEYLKLLTELHTDLLDVLHSFPSCHPPLDRLIELLPRLQRRYYSATSSPLMLPNKVRIAFNVVELPERPWLCEGRKGLATGWFDRATQNLKTSTVKVPMFPRVQNPFHLPADPFRSIIMIGPGTGVAPFISFLQHRKKLGEISGVGKAKRSRASGKAWLFFGCRHPDKDFLYREELEGFVADGTLTHLHVAFSRHDSSEGGTKYVQDCMRLHWKELAVWIMEEAAVVYVCGDAAGMSKDVREAMLDVLGSSLKEKGSDHTAECMLTGMREEGRYLLDVWT